MTANDLNTYVDSSPPLDRSAIDRVLSDYLPPLLGYIQHHIDPVTRAHESSEDILQSVCREVIEHQDEFEFRGQAALRSWLYKTATNKLIDRRRYYTADKRHPRRETYISNVSQCSRVDNRGRSPLSPSQAASTREEIERLEWAFSMLSEDHQEVIRLSRFDGRCQAEIAEKMDRTVPAVRTLLHRALGRLGLLMHRAENGLLGEQPVGDEAPKTFHEPLEE